MHTVKDQGYTVQVTTTRKWFRHDYHVEVQLDHIWSFARG
jgi:hypothetical protein